MDSNNVETSSKRETVGFTAVSGSTVTTLSRGLAGSSDQDHAVGAIVEFAADVVWAQSMYDALANVVDVTTSAVDTTKVLTPSGTQNVFNKMISGATLSSPTINFGSGATGSVLYEGGSKKVERLALGATHSFLVATATQPAWYYASGASGSVLTSTGTGLPVYAASATAVTPNLVSYNASPAYSTASTSFVDVDGTNLKMTIVTTNSHKVRIMVSGSFKGSTTQTVGFKIVRDPAGTPVTIAYQNYDISGSIYRGFTILAVDAPSTGSNVYSLQWATNTGTATMAESTYTINMSVEEIQT